MIKSKERRTFLEAAIAITPLAALGQSSTPQYLANAAFREPVPAYKHSAAVFLHLTGQIPNDLTHPKNPNRPLWEAQILQDCARRLEH